MDFRSKTVAELEKMGFYVDCHYSTSRPDGIASSVVLGPTEGVPADESAKLLEEDEKPAAPALKPKTKAKSEKEPTVEELQIAIRVQMVRISKITSKKDALAILVNMGYKKLTDVPEDELSNVLAKLEGE